VLAEAAAYPPQRALLISPVPKVGLSGIWGPRGTLKLELLWVNRADFPIHVRDLHIRGRVGGQQCEWDSVLGEEFVVGPRSDFVRVVEIDPCLPLPSFDRGGANCDLSIAALVCGPWEDGRAQHTRDLIPHLGIYLPVIGIEPSGIMTDDADVDLMIDDYLQALVAKGEETVRIIYADFDRSQHLRAGGTKERLGVVAGRRRHTVDAAPNVARVTLHNPPQYLGPGGYSFGTGGRSDFEDPDF